MPEDSGYLLPAPNVSEETERLEKYSKRIREFLGGKLSLAPLEETCKPARILELGSGSGYWAVQAAETFPEAEVTAVDISPIPSYQLQKCSNLQFQLHDIRQPYPFEPASFDIIHSRLVFMNLPKLEETITRTAALLKPGGYLLIESVTFGFDDDTIPIGPGVATFWGTTLEDLKRRGIDPKGARMTAHYMEQIGTFETVTNKMVKCSAQLPGKVEDPAFFLLSEALRDSFIEGPLLHLPVSTPEIVNQVLEEMRDPERDMYFEAYWVWGRRKGDD